MSLLNGSSPGSFARIGGGIGSVSGIKSGELRPMPRQRVQPAIGTKDSVGISRFRRHVNGLTTDVFNAPLPGATVLVFAAGTDTLVQSVVSDAQGNYDVAVYSEGTTYKVYAKKAGSPNVFGASDDTITAT